MKASQYIYTSWKNGNLPDKGFMIYSKSSDITNEECDDIRFVMQYVVPKEMTPNPTQDEITASFPYSFSYFKLPSGRECVAQTTYLGKDYSGRFGNYIIYALVFDANELNAYPIELFGEDIIKAAMTEAELNAVPPIAPLPQIEIDDLGNVINDDQIMEFLYDKEDEFSYLVSAILAARKSGVPFYLNDTRENLVLWIAAVQKMLPLTTAKKVTFSTYVGNHEKFRLDSSKARGLDLYCFGVRPDANYFNYLSGSKSSQQIVMDFVDGNMTEGIEILDYAKSMSSSYTLDMDEINKFIQFLDEIEFYEFNTELESAFKLYDLYKLNNLNNADADLSTIIKFGEKYCPSDVNAQLGAKIIDKVQDNLILSTNNIITILPYLYIHSNFMMFSIHDILYHSLFEYAEHLEQVQNNSDCMFGLLTSLKEKNRNEFIDFLKYFETDEVITQSLNYLDGNYNRETNLFFCKIIFRYYELRDGLKSECNVAKVLSIILKNIIAIDDNITLVIELLKNAQENIRLIVDILTLLLRSFSETKVEQFGAYFGKWMDELTEDTRNDLQTAMVKAVEIRPFAVYLCAMYIAASSEPEKAFWNSYNNQFARATEDTDLSLMITVYLKRSETVEAAIKILETVSEKNIQSEKAVIKLVNKLGELSVKALYKVNLNVLIKLIVLTAQFSMTKKIDKIMIVCFARKLEASIRKGEQLDSLAKNIESIKVRMCDFEKKDYQEYMSEATVVFINCIDTTEAFRALLRMVYHEKYLDSFSDELIDLLKKMEKKHERKWIKLISVISAYLIDFETTDFEAKSFVRLFARYLRKLDDEDLKFIQSETFRNCQNKDSDFFIRASEKEGLGDKLGGLFGKNKF